MGFHSLRVSHISTEDLFQLPLHMALLVSHIAASHSELIATYSVHLAVSAAAESGRNADADKRSCTQIMVRCYRALKDYDAQRMERAFWSLSQQKDTLLFALVLIKRDSDNVALQSHCARVAFAKLVAALSSSAKPTLRRSVLRIRSVLVRTLLCPEHLSDAQRVSLCSWRNKRTRATWTCQLSHLLYLQTRTQQRRAQSS